MAKFYKVVYVCEDGSLQTVCQNYRLPNKYRVRYALDVKTLPNVEGTKLFVFDSEENASAFSETMRWSCRTAIYECEVENPTKLERVPYPCYAEKFWNNEMLLDDKYQDKTITGSHLVDSVTLIKLVKTLNWDMDDFELAEANGEEN